MGDRLGTPGAVGFWRHFRCDFALQNAIQRAQINGRAKHNTVRSQTHARNIITSLIIVITHKHDRLRPDVSFLKKKPYPQPNIEIRKPNMELMFTLISVTICSLIFFICTFSKWPSERHSFSQTFLVVRNS